MDLKRWKVFVRIFEAQSMKYVQRFLVIKKVFSVSQGRVQYLPVTRRRLLWLGPAVEVKTKMIEKL